MTATAEAGEAPSRRLRVETALLAAALLAVAFAGLHDIHVLRYQPAGAHGFDDISYHLSEVATWIRYGDLRMIRFSMGDPSTPFYPVLGELSSWVLIAPFGDSDVAARWSSSPSPCSPSWRWPRSPAGWECRAGTPPSPPSSTPRSTTSSRSWR